MQFIAFYLPQFHSIPENDDWWGAGFTEWTNVKKAKPLFWGHKQPVYPGELGYYNLLNQELQQRQVKIAKEYGISGFAYWHYWFGNKKQLLQKPVANLLNYTDIDFPFCLSWANQTWTGVWHGAEDRVLIKQEYLGIEDDINHFYYCLSYFKDRRYIKFDGKPIFLIYKPDDHPYLEDFIDLWQSLAFKEGLIGIHFIGIKSDAKLNNGLNSIARQDFWFENRTRKLQKKSFLFSKIILSFIERLKRKYFNCDVQSYNDMVNFTYNFNLESHEFPTVLTGWDNTPRSGFRGKVLINYTPKLLYTHILKVFNLIKDRENKVVFVKSWNEWAEGNYLEPDQINGYSFLDVFKRFKDA